MIVLGRNSKRNNSLGALPLFLLAWQHLYQRAQCFTLQPKRPNLLPLSISLQSPPNMRHDLKQRNFHIYNTKKDTENDTNDMQRQEMEEKALEALTENVEEPLRTIRGGQSEIFSMARRMMVWNEDFGYSTTTSTSSSSSSSSSSNTTPSIKPLPRWHPHEGIGDSNPSFRSKSPPMNNKGYALLIRRNSRKRNKQSLWRHAYRTYHKMKTLEEEQQQEIQNNNGKLTSSKILIMRHVIHYEAALVSCAKLGLWREALSIFQNVVEVMEKQKRMVEEEGMNSTFTSYVQTSDGKMVKRRIPRIVVTDNMILAIVSACVRGSKVKQIQPPDVTSNNHASNTNSETNTNSNTSSNSNNKASQLEARREPLDCAREILLSMEEKYNIPLVSIHVNQLASAYHHIGLYSEGSSLIEQNLPNRITVAQDKEEELAASFNVNDVKAKDAASYNILIQGAIQGGDWEKAIGSLRQMTEKGLFPEGRSLNCWSETAQKRERRAGSRKTTWRMNRERLIAGTLPVANSNNSINKMEGNTINPIESTESKE